MRKPQNLSADLSTAPTAGEATAFETRLLTAARTDQIPPTLKLRMAHALEIPATASGGARGMSKALLSSKALLALSALVLVAIGGGWGWQRTHAGSTPPHSQNNIASTPATPPTTVATDEPPAMPSGVAVPAAPPTLAEPGAHAASPGRGHDGGSDLRAEIALLDTAREAMKNGASTQALGALDRYARRFSRGAFAPEAEVLRIEALVHDGQSERARALGRRFLAQHPSSPLAERVERTLSVN